MSGLFVSKTLNTNRIPEVSLFKPGRNYFASIANNFATNGLVIPILERFPFQPSMPAFHPALESDYLIKKSYKGSYFYLAQSYRDEKEFYQLVRARARKRGLADLEKLQADLERKLLEQHWDEEFRKSREKTLLRFEITAERKRELTKVFFELLAAAYWKTRNFAETRTEIYDARREDTHDKFWEEVYKNLEKEPKETPLSGSNKQSVLMALSYAESKSGVYRALSKIEDNRLLMGAENIIERLAGNSVPGLLRGLMTQRFHRPSHEKELRKEVKEEAYEEYLESIKELARQRDVRYMELKQERIEGVEERITQYWGIVDKLREKIFFSVSLQGTNEQTLKNYLRHREACGLFYGLNTIKENRNKARANQIVEHLSGIMPELLHFSNIKFVRKDWEEQLRAELKVERSRDHDMAREEYQFIQKEQVIERRTQNIEAIEERVAEYWQARDKANEMLNLSVSSAGSSANEALRKSLKTSFTKVLKALTNVEELKGNDMVDPFNSKTRKSNVSYQQGWIDYYYKPKEPLPTPREPLERVYLDHHPDNIPRGFEFDYQWKHPFSFGYFWQLSPLTMANQLPQNAGDFSPNFPPDSKTGVYEVKFSYEPQLQRPMPLARKGRDELPRTSDPWEFEKGFDVRLKEKTIDKTGIVLNRNRNDAQDSEFTFKIETNTSPSVTAPADKFIEENKILVQNAKSDAYFESQQTFPIRFKAVSEHALAAHEPQKEYLMQHFALTDRNAAYESVFKSKPLTLSKVERLAALGGDGVAWGLNQPEPMHFKKKFPKADC
ncbi:MAG: hypothetical protein HRU09_12420 [Oligoflexales bacterium]|nr:hypothetical protein [Oligoflexales bacterium]